MIQKVHIRIHCFVQYAFYAKGSESATGGTMGIVQVSGMTARVLAPAKVNLFIEILGKRSDGFHEIIPEF